MNSATIHFAKRSGVVALFPNSDMLSDVFEDSGGSLRRAVESNEKKWPDFACMNWHTLLE